MSIEQTYSFDLSRSHTIKDVNWPAGHRSELLVYDDCDIRLKVTPDQVFSARLHQVVITRSGEVIQEISMKFADMTAEAAYVQARELAVAWNLDDRRLDVWRANARTADGEVFETIRNDVLPRISLSIRHSFDESRPWFVMFKFAWPLSRS
jgi:hypothetical protein